MSENPVRQASRPRSYQELLASDSRPAPQAMSRRGVTDMGPLEVPTSWYLDPAIHQLEVERIWKSSWQMVCREEDLRDVGDTWVYDVASLSFVVVRSSADTIKAFYNSCLHRGRPLRDCPGNASQLKCPFHGFTWSLDGDLRGVPSREQFPTITNEGFRLPEVKVARWGGFVFINPDPIAEALESYIGDLPEQFARYPMESKRKYFHITKVFPANWKIVQDAFLEAFHVHTTHPQWTIAYSDDLHQYDVFGNYSRIIIPAANPSHQLRWTPSEKEIFDCMIGVWEEASTEVEPIPNGNVRQSIAQKFREQTRPLLGDAVDTYSDAEMLDVVMYNLFPNFGPFSHPNMSLVYTMRPYGDDVGKCLFEVIGLMTANEDADRPRVPERRLGEDEKFSDVPELDFFGAILNQDTFHFEHMMRGIRNNQRKKLVLASHHELKLRHFYQLYADKMDLSLEA